MPPFKIDTISVKFPKDPYDVQKEFMRSMMTALKGDKLALLESPTGTGKTLCLLTTALAWQEWDYNKRKRERGNSNLGGSLAHETGDVSAQQQNAAISNSLGFSWSVEGNAESKKKIKPKTIIYASRTHSQLKQVVQELRATDYRVETVVLGSRDQMCINERVKSKQYRQNGGNTSLIHACHRAVKSRSCKFKNNLDHDDGSWFKSLSLGNTRVPDIEDLVKSGKRDSVCPYFAVREASTNAKLVLMPYNYLLDASVRSTLDVDWAGAAVIFDEAHNVEKAACDAVSFTLTSAELGQCIGDLKKVLLSVKAVKDGDGPEKVSEVEINLNSLIDLMNLVLNLEERLDRVPLREKVLGPTASAVLPGVWLSGALRASRPEKRRAKGFLESKLAVLEQLRDIVEYKMSMDITASTNAGNIVVSKLERLLKFFSLVYPNKNEEPAYIADYKVYLCRLEEKEDERRRSSSSKSAWELNYWGFSPGIAMMDIKMGEGVGPIVLTSGTLSPMSNLHSDLKLPGTPIELLNKHVIDLNKQVWVGAIGTGPGGQRLSSTYEVRETTAYKDDLGRSVLKILEMMSKCGNNRVGLQGGVLIFFPSYKAMEDMERRWKQTSSWNEMEKLGGSVIMEPKTMGKAPSSSSKTNRSQSPYRGDSAMNKKSTKPAKKLGSLKFGFDGEDTSDADDDDNDDEEEEGGLKNFIRQFENILKRKGRCILLAVCRGKVSEGIDFTDKKGRVVIMTGIPYSPPNDPWVSLKKQYMDERCIRRVDVASVSSEGSAPNGTGWASAVQNSNKGFGSGLLAPGWGAGGYEAMSRKEPTNGFGASKSISATSTMLTGDQWYKQSACRAVNQALGRIIRHKKDWGAIFLLDERFQYPSQRDQLSQWMRPRHCKYIDFGKAMESFQGFINRASTDEDLQLEGQTRVESEMGASERNGENMEDSISDSRMPKGKNDLFITDEPSDLIPQPNPQPKMRPPVRVGENMKVYMSYSQMPEEKSESSFIDPALLAKNSVDILDEVGLWSKKREEASKVSGSGGGGRSAAAATDNSSFRKPMQPQSSLFSSQSMTNMDSKKIETRNDMAHIQDQLDNEEKRSRKAQKSLSLKDSKPSSIANDTILDRVEQKKHMKETMLCFQPLVTETVFKDMVSLIAAMKNKKGCY